MVTALDLIGSDQSLQDHWLKRFIAFIIDAIIIYVIASIIFFFLPVPFLWGWGMGYSLMAGGMLFLYSALMEMSSGGTLGKNIMNLRVISLHGDLESGSVFVRNISKIHGLFLLLDWLIGFVTDGDPKQRFLDRSAGTTVLLTDQLGSGQQHTYQSQQSQYAPPPPQQYTSHETPVYQYPAQEAPPPTQEETDEELEPAKPCGDCGGRLTLTGSGRMQCIRCGRIY